MSMAGEIVQASLRSLKSYTPVLKKSAKTWETMITHSGFPLSRKLTLFELQAIIILAKGKPMERAKRADTMLPMLPQGTARST